MSVTRSWRSANSSGITGPRLWIGILSQKSFKIVSGIGKEHNFIIDQEEISMGKIVTALLLVMLITVLVALPALAETKDITPADPVIKKSKPGGSYLDTSPAAPVDEWLNLRELGRAADGSIRILVDGKIIDPDVKPFIDNSDRTQAPFRAIGEALGCTVDWSDPDRKVTCTKTGFTVEMFIGNDTIWVNGKPQVIDTAPQIKEDRTFIPVRALGEALTCGVAWNEPSQTVIINSNGF